jgi:hypothetical protein
MSRRAGWTLARTAFALAISIVGGACEAEDGDDTRVMVVIDAEPAVRQVVADVELVVTSGTGPVSGWALRHESSLTPGDGPVPWPLEVGLEPRAGNIDVSYQVVATALGVGGETLAQVRAVSGYIAGADLRLPMVFDLACLQRDTLCNETSTCLAGACVDPQIAPEDLARAGQAAADGPGQGGEDPADAGQDPDGPSTVDAGAGDPIDVQSDGEPECDGSSVDCIEAVECPGGRCEGCPSGYVDDGGCVPFLASLGHSAGRLTPGLDALQTDYTLELPLLARTFTVEPVVASGVQLEVTEAEELDGGRFEVGPVPAMGSPELELTLTGDGGADRDYTFALQRDSRQLTYLKSSRASEGDTLGRSVALRGSTLVVGAPGEDAGATDSGAVYVFEREPGGGVSEQARLTGPAVEGAGFGSCVALDGELMVVGSPYDDATSGAVHVFRRSGDRWNLVQRITHPQPALFNEFGIALDLLDGRLAVGATGDDREGLDRGAVFIYAWDGNAFGAPTRLHPETQSGWFGSSVSLDAERLAVGATGDSDLGLVAGAAYLFQHDGERFVQQARFTAERRGEGDFFGESIDLDGDTLVVGAFGDPTEALEGGAVHVFRQMDGGWRLEQRVAPEVPLEGAHFGARVALQGELMLVGGGNGSAGRVHVFERHGGDWREIATLPREPFDPEDRFGGAVAIDGENFLVGAYGEDSASRSVDGDASNDDAPSAGAAYLLR